MTLIDRTLSIASGAGLQVTHLDVNAFAIWDMLLSKGRLKIGETVALVDLGSEKMSLFLFKDEILQFSREMTPAGADLTRAITDGIPFERDLGFLFEKAERIKEEVGILSGIEEGRVAGEKLDFSKISFLMRPVLERWVAEIGRSLDYYRHQSQCYCKGLGGGLGEGVRAHRPLAPSPNPILPRQRPPRCWPRL